MTEKTYTLPEVKQELAKALRQRVEEFSQEMLALRKKELAKSVEKCDTDDVKRLNKEERCSKCGKTECCCGEIETKPKEPVKAQEGSGGKISKLNKDTMNPTMGVTGGELSAGSGSIEDMEKTVLDNSRALRGKIAKMGRRLNPFRDKSWDAHMDRVADLSHQVKPYIPLKDIYGGHQGLSQLMAQSKDEKAHAALPPRVQLGDTTFIKDPNQRASGRGGYHTVYNRHDVVNPQMSALGDYIASGSEARLPVQGGEGVDSQNNGRASPILAKRATSANAKDMATMANQAAYEAHRSKGAAPALKVKLPSPADNAARANNLQDFMPAGKFTPGGAGLPHERSPLLGRKLGKTGLNPTKPTAAPTKPAATKSPGAATPAVSAPPKNNVPKNTAPKAPSPASAPGAKDLKP